MAYLNQEGHFLFVWFYWTFRNYKVDVMALLISLGI